MLLCSCAPVLLCSCAPVLHSSAYYCLCNHMNKVVDLLEVLTTSGTTKPPPGRPGASRTLSTRCRDACRHGSPQRILSWKPPAHTVTEAPSAYCHGSPSAYRHKSPQCMPPCSSKNHSYYPGSAASLPVSAGCYWEAHRPRGAPGCYQQRDFETARHHSHLSLAQTLGVNVLTLTLALHCKHAHVHICRCCALLKIVTNGKCWHFLVGLPS